VHIIIIIKEHLLEVGQLLTYSRKSKWHPTVQSLARSPFWIGFAATTLSLRSRSDALGGTSTAGELLKNPYGCITNRIRAAGSQSLPHW